GAVIAEAIEGASAGERADRDAVLSLVEECTGLLTVPRGGEIAYAVLSDLDLARNGAAQQLDGGGQPFLRAQRNVVARENAKWLNELLEGSNDVIAPPLPSRCRRAVSVE